MGFCLLEHARDRGSYFAVNPEYVDDIELKIELEDGTATCLLHMNVATAPFVPLAVGHKDQVRDVMMQALRLGMNKVELDILGGYENQSKTPLLLSSTGRIVLVRELTPNEIGGEGALSATASHMLFSDGKVRVIAQRPARFVQLANMDAVIPMIEGD